MSGFTATYEVKINFIDASGEAFDTIATVDVDEVVFGANPIADVIAEAIEVTSQLGTFVSATLLARIDRTPQKALAI